MNRVGLRASALLLSAALCLSLCACTGGELTIAAPSQDIADAAATAQPKIYADRIVMAMSAQEKSTDPYLLDSYKTQALLGMVYETPLALDRSGYPEPYLCKSWSVGTGGAVTFMVRENVTFTSGEAFTAEHIAAALRRINAQGKGSPYYYVIEAISSWKVSQDAAAITITPSGSVYSLLMAMDFPITDSDGLTGTGPYRIESFTAGEGMELVRNDGWWMVAPTIRLISVRATESDEAQVQGLAMGELDAAVSRGNMSEYKESSRYNAAMLRTGDFEFIAMNCAQDAEGAPMSALGGKGARLAVAMALDIKEIISTVYQGMATASAMPLANDMWAYPTGLALPESDAEAAREALAAAGYTDDDGDGFVERKTADGSSEPLVLRVITNSDAATSFHKDAAQRVARQLAAVGVSAEVETLTMTELKKRLGSGDYDIACLGVSLGTAPDLRAFYGTGGALNYSAYSSGDMDALLDALDAAATEQAYADAVGAVLALAAEDMPIYGLCYKCGYLFTSTALTGVGDVGWRAPMANIDQWRMELAE